MQAKQKICSLRYSLYRNLYRSYNDYAISKDSLLRDQASYCVTLIYLLRMIKFYTRIIIYFVYGNAYNIYVLLIFEIQATSDVYKNECMQPLANYTPFPIKIGKTLCRNEL